MDQRVQFSSSQIFLSVARPGAALAPIGKTHPFRREHGRALAEGGERLVQVWAKSQPVLEANLSPERRDPARRHM